MRQSLWQSLVLCLVCLRSTRLRLDSGYSAFVTLLHLTSDSEVDALSLVNVHVHALWARQGQGPARVTRIQVVFFWSPAHRCGAGVMSTGTWFPYSGVTTGVYGKTHASSHPSEPPPPLPPSSPSPLHPFLPPPSPPPPPPPTHTHTHTHTHLSPSLPSPLLPLLLPRTHAPEAGAGT